MKCWGIIERRLFSWKKKLEIMIKANQSGRLIVDEIEIEAQPMRKKYSWHYRGGLYNRS